MTDLAKACIYYRARNDITQKEMGKRCGLSRQLIIDVEHDRPVSVMTETKIKIVAGGELQNG